MEAKQEYRSSVYVWGSTAHGALGCLDPKVKAASTKKVQLVPKKLTECCTMRVMNGGNPLRVVVGNGYSTVITDKFEGYTWGDERGGGGSSERRKASVALRAKAGPCKMKKVQASSITSIAHGIGHNYVLSLKGELYCWGDGNNLGLGTSKSADSNDHHDRPRPHIGAGGNESRRTFTNPTKIDIGVYSSKVTAVACGEKHACILLQNGMIMTTGANDAGQLGIGVVHDEKLKEKGRGFNIIQNFRRGNSCLNCVTFKEIACGNNHCAAISSDGALLYTWGWGDAGRLGMGNEKMHNQPTCVESLSLFGPFAVVACGSAQTLVATEGGDVYGFGWNAHGQVSGAIKNDHAGGSSDSCLLPVLCLKNKVVVKLSCSGFHSAAITLAGDLYMWGMNEDGECGAGHEQLITAPSKVSFPDTGAEQYAVAVSCGRSFTVCIMSNYLPLDAEDVNNQLQKETLEAESVNKRIFAAQLIVRFARRMVRKKPAPVIQIVDVDPSPDDASEEFQLESSSSSSHSSMLEDVITMNAEAEPQNEDQFIDEQKVSDEDLHSSVDVSPVEIIGEHHVPDDESGIEQEITEAEPHKMRAEAVISRILHEQPKPIRSPKQKSNAAPVRDDQIDKAATRMKLARERREQQAVARKILPRVQRSAVTKIQHERKEHITKKSLTVNVEQKSDAELAHLEWNKKLLERRELRLKAKDQAEIEAALIRERDMRIEREREKLVEQQSRMNLEKQKRNAKNARALQLLKESEELKRLEEKLKSPDELTLPRGNENKEYQSNFRDLMQWTKALSGA